MPGTLFVCGRTLLQALEPVQAAHATGLFDVQQHTFSHVPFKDIVYSPEPGHRRRRSRPRRRSRCSRSSRSRPGCSATTSVSSASACAPRSATTAACATGPDLLEIVRGAGLRYITSWGRNEENGNPTPWVQPFTYDEEGYPDILELPFQFWLDVVWFDQHGYDTGPAFLEALKGAVDEVADNDLVYGACFHDWVMLASDERHVGWLRGFFRYARERGVEVTTYTDYWRRVCAG